MENYEAQIEVRAQENYEEDLSANKDSLIVVKQLPIIEQQLLSIKERFFEEAEKALLLECTDETLQIVKQKRAELTKVFKALESRRIEVKKTILSPYEAFEKIYKECVTDIYNPCDTKLRDKISEVERTLKAKKREEAEAYFFEYCESKQIDFLTFDRLGINITLNVSKKNLREQIKSFLDKVSDELKLISTQDNSEEIMLEYRKSLNAAQAIMLVTNRHKAIEEERKRNEERRAIETEQEKAVEKVDTVINSFTPPKQEAVPEEEKTYVEEEKKYRVSFSIIGTLSQLKALKDFLVKGGYQYDQQ